MTAVEPALAPAGADVSTILEAPVPVGIAMTLAAFRVGGHDPSIVIESHRVWRTTRTPEGPATVQLRDALGAPVVLDSDAVAVDAWGPGAGWALDHASELLGLHDTAPFDPPTGLVRDAHRHHRGLRIGASRAVVEAIIPVILEQKVTSIEAHRSYRRLMRAFGEPAPGPATRMGLCLRPDPARLATLGYADLHRFGIERRRADTILRVCRRAPSLERFAARPTTDELVAAAPAARAAFASVPGIGPWTTAIVAQQAFGDGDAVITGDYHLPNMVAFNLAGEPRATDERMLELLAPFAGHRGRAVRLIGLAGRRAPRYGPGKRTRSFARF